MIIPREQITIVLKSEIHLRFKKCFTDKQKRLSVCHDSHWVSHIQWHPVKVLYWNSVRAFSYWSQKDFHIHFRVKLERLPLSPWHYIIVICCPVFHSPWQGTLPHFYFDLIIFHMNFFQILSDVIKKAHPWDCFCFPLRSATMAAVQSNHAFINTR